MRFPITVGNNTNIYPNATFKFIINGSIKIGNNCMIEDYAVVSTSCGNITIGDNFSLETSSTIYGGGGLTIGNNVMIASHVVVVPSNHNFSRTDIPMNLQGATMKGIIIKDDVWIGCGCMILDGVTIGEGCIIGAGAVVNKSIPDYSIAVGVPAKVIKSRLDTDKS